MSGLPGAAEVAVIGGGVIGLSVAFHLAEAGIDCVLLERERLGAGVSSAAAGALRAYFPGEASNSALAAPSVARYQELAGRTGVDIGLRRTGFLVILQRGEQIDDFERWAEDQRQAGVEVELLSPAQAVERQRLLDPSRIRAAAWSPQAYVCDAPAILRGLAEGAVRLGARIVTGAAVESIDGQSGRVVTAIGAIEARRIVCAAGPWSPPLAAQAGVELPMIADQDDLFLTDPLPDRPPVPLTLHAGSGIRIREYGEELLVGMHAPSAGQSRDDMFRQLVDELGRVYPALAGVPLRPAWSGRWDASVDGVPYIGQAPGGSRFFYATAFSGHGYCQALAAGELLRDLLLGRTPALDPARFSVDRAR